MINQEKIKIINTLLKKYMKIEFNKIYNMDCMKGMKNISSNSVDLVVTDPPFAIEFGPKRRNYNIKKSRVLKGYKEILKDDYYDFTINWMKEASRTLKDSGSMYIFSGWNNLKDILNSIDELGLTTVNHIIWKYQFGVVTKRKYVTSHYHCLYVCKNDKERKFFPYSRYSKEMTDGEGSLHYKDKEDVWVIKREYWNGDEKTPTKLPAELIRKILLYSSEEGDIVLDPFLGSGQTAVISKMLKRKYIGFEIVPEYHDFIMRRLNSGQYRIKSKK